ncbi:MAG TPA: polyprenyl synthetase family protein [Actinomycetota bacterium]|nr:polyprenyl synthetase family protein [Actinomycetota bacterium]
MTPSPNELRARIDEALTGFLSAVRVDVAAADPAALPMIDELSRVVGAGGKRLRPLFCYWGHRAAGGEDSDAIVRAGTALELLHTFAIVHDDIMDGSPLRRGLAASHVAMGSGRFGTSAAILTGDLAFALADRLLLEAGFDAVRLSAAFDWFTRMRLEVIAGQFADLVAAERREADEPAARRIAALKSGAYTVEKPLVIGAALAGATPQVIEALTAFGAPLGEAFQIRDDVLGAFGEPSVTGKDAEGDLREGKRTVLVAKARAQASAEDRTFLDAALGSPDLTDADIERVRDVLRSSGALDATLALIDELHAKALAELEAAPLISDVKQALRVLAETAVSRDA